MTDLEAFGYACALALAGVLLVAAVAKVVANEATRASFRSLRLPAPRALAVVVPVAELGVAVLLVCVPWIGAVAALAMLAVFTVFLAAQFRKDDPVGCACFGAASQEPIGPSALVRNAFLMLLAVGALAAGAPGNPGLAALVLVSVMVVMGIAALAIIDLAVARVPLWRIDRGGP